MTDPERLLAGGTAFEQSLLHAGAADKPNAAMLAKMEQGLGLSATAGPVSVSKLVLTAVGTTVVGGLAAWGLVSGDVGSAESGEPVAPRSVEMDAVSTVFQVPVEVGSNEAPPVPPAPQVGASPSEPTSGVDPAPRVQKPGKSRASGTAAAHLSEEVRALDRVRAALESGNRRRAIELLDSYDRRFPNGTLRPESSKLRGRAHGLD